MRFTPRAVISPNARLGEGNRIGRKMARRQFLAYSGAGLAACRRIWAQEGQFIGTVPFLDERDAAVGRVTGRGLNGRLALDLSTLTPQMLTTPNDQFFIRTRYPDRLRAGAPWKIRVHGLVERVREIPVSELVAAAEPQGVHLLECAGNSAYRNFGLISAAAWEGLPVKVLLEKAGILPQATRVLISGFDGHCTPAPGSVPGAGWIFSLDEVETYRPFLATEMNGVPLARDHGYPVRLVMPGWYGCTCAKWVNEIVLLDDLAPATAQMKEYAARTHQAGVPHLAGDFEPAIIDQVAMAVRVEKWCVAGAIRYRVIGILWGGQTAVKALMIRFNPALGYEPVRGYVHETNATWTLWSHAWRPKERGRYAIQLKIDDPGIRTRRLDAGYYVRRVEIKDV